MIVRDTGDQPKQKPIADAAMAQPGIEHDEPKAIVGEPTAKEPTHGMVHTRDDMADAVAILAGI